LYLSCLQQLVFIVILFALCCFLLSLSILFVGFYFLLFSGVLLTLLNGFFEKICVFFAFYFFALAFVLDPFFYSGKMRAICLLSWVLIADKRCLSPV